jgi:site-specific DNA recombinase
MKFALYCRKSTESDDRQVLSLDSQEKELLALAEQFGLNIVKKFRESKSAKAPGRPQFNEMMRMLETGKIDGIICWKLDRLARNFVDGGKIIDLLQRGVIQKIHTYEGVHLPTDNVILIAVNFGSANQYIRDLSSNIKRGNRAKLEKGDWPNSAPFGYKNDKLNKKIVVDESKAKYATRAFELYATGSHSFKDISNILFAEGLRAGTDRKFFASGIHKFMDNPFYCGLMQRDGKLYAGNHTPLVSKELFDQAQDVLHNRHRPRPKNHFFPLRGFMTCETCGCALTASLKKGHHYYYCTNGKGICTEHKTYLRENTLYPIVASLFEKVTLDEEVIEMMYQAAKEETEQDSSYSESILIPLRNRLNALTARESKLLDAFLDSQISKEAYDGKVLEIQNEKTILSKQISDIELKHANALSTLEPTKNIFLRASRAKKEFLKGDDAKKREVVETLLWNLSIKDQKMAQYEFKSPYCILSKVPKDADFQTMRSRRDSNP